MRLLLITDGIAPFVIGGMQKHSFQLARNLALLGHHVTLVHCVYGKNKMPSNEEITSAFGNAAMANLEIISMRFPAASWYPGHYVKESYIYSSAIFKKLEARLAEFDFIYTKGFTGWRFIEKKKTGTKMPPVGIKFHGYEMLQPPAGWRMRMHNMILRGPVKWINTHADYVFSYGGKITDLITTCGVNRSRIIEIPTGIEQEWITNVYSTISNDTVRMVFVGRYERRKGVEELTEALRQMLPLSNLEFHFIGPIPPSARIASPSIFYHGSISDNSQIRKLLDNCQIIVVPSHSEGMPNVIMEGMSRGLAVIATDVGAVRTVVSEANGWFVKAGDVASLRALLTSLISTERATIAKKQEASLSSVIHYSWENIARITASRIAELKG